MLRDGSGAFFVFVSLHLLRRADDYVTGRVASEAERAFGGTSLNYEAKSSYD